MTRILVTGGSGFLGRYVVAELRSHGYDDVVAPRHADYDLTRDAHVERMFAELRPTQVVHLAARVGGIGYNRAHPGTSFYETLAMGLNVLEYGRQAGVEKIVAVSSVCAYPRDVPMPMREDDLWAGYPEATNAPYGLAKKMLGVQGQAYQEEFGMCVVTLLQANLYGPGDNFDPRSSHVIPALIRKCVEAKEAGDQEIEVWGTGTASREFLYVADAARAIRMALARYESAEPVNVGSGTETTIRDLVARIAAATGFAGSVRWDTSKPDGQPRRLLDTSRARDRFGFAAEVSLEDGLAATVEWYRKARAEGVVP